MPIGLPHRRFCALALLAVLVVGCGRGGSVTLQPPGPADAGPADAGVVSTSTGMVRGVVGADYRLFQGIPYAAPPVGPLRWEPPLPAARWSGVRDASKPGPQCIQESTHEPGVDRPSSEDCLTLNVWTPAAAPENPEKRQVMVWVHGGGFINGSGDIYDARWLAARGGIVVVTINYRLGALGFLAHPSLGPPDRAGNYGLADQQAALRWVRDNVANFGGDPRRVTIAGESAGAMSVCDHLVAPGSAGLFRAAIIQSGPCQAHAALATAQRSSVDYAASVGCPDVAAAAQCLRSVPTTALARPLFYSHIGADALSGPVTGTAALPVDPVAAFASGRVARVPVLIGTNHDEFTMFAALRYLRLGRAMTGAEYPGVLADIFGADGGAVLAHYPPDRFGGDVSLAYSAAVTDGVFACVADRMADTLRRRAPVYSYEFDDPHAPDPLRKVPFPLGASHSLELRYLFDVGGAPPLNPAQRKLSSQMIDYWSQFVRTGAPEVADQPDWPAMDGDPGPRMSLRPDGSTVITTFAESHQCPFWATLKHS